MSGTAHISIPPLAKDRPSQATVLTSASPATDVNAVFNGLDELLAATRGLPVEDRLKALVPALIERGMNTRDRIVGAARKKNFNEKAAGKLLTKYTGTLWHRGKDGIYRVI
jgi:hypothetical protein